MNAETVIHTEAYGEENVNAASMGPRSHERGNMVDEIETKEKKVKLQWGRVLMNAETRVGRDGRPRLQRASMGPRSHERGNMCGCWLHRPGGQASMGPRSHERGNGYGPLGWRRPPPASMGPRSHERGNTGKTIATVCRLGRFNGAAFS